MKLLEKNTTVLSSALVAVLPLLCPLAQLFMQSLSVYEVYVTCRGDRHSKKTIQWRFRLQGGFARMRVYSLGLVTSEASALLFPS